MTDNRYYLLSLAFSGIKNISEEVRLDFYKKVIDKNFNADKHRIKAIYGENGTGKTAIITVVDILRNILFPARYLDQDSTQIFLNEIVNKKSQKVNISCEFLMIKDNLVKVYKYYVQLVNRESNYIISEESLHVKNGRTNSNKYKLVYKVCDGELQYFIYDDVRKDLEKKSLNLLYHNSLASIYFNSSLSEDDAIIEELINPLEFMVNVHTYFDREDQHESYIKRQVLDKISSRENSSDDFNRLSDYFFSINGKTIVPKGLIDVYSRKVMKLETFLKIFKKDLKSIEIDKKIDGEDYKCELNMNYGEYSVNEEFESTGIKKLIHMFDCLVEVSRGGIAFIDEMDSNINDVYLRKMIEYFMYYGKGQMCFTTHNISPMELLRKNSNAIDFITSDGKIVPWTKSGNYAPDNRYKEGMIKGLPFNVDSVSFIKAFGD